MIELFKNKIPRLEKPKHKKDAQILLKTLPRLREGLIFHFHTTFPDGSWSPGAIEVQPTIQVTDQNRRIAYTPTAADTSRFGEIMPEFTNFFTFIAGRISSDGSRTLGCGDLENNGVKFLTQGKALLTMNGLIEPKPDGTFRSRTPTLPFVINEDVDMRKKSGFKKSFDETVLKGTSKRFQKEVQKWEDLVFVNAATAENFPLFNNLEDYSTIPAGKGLPGGKGFYLLNRLQEIQKKLEFPVPVWWDDKQGTAVMNAGAILNALKDVGKDIKDVKIVLNGAGAACLGTLEYLLLCGANPENIIMTDINGVIYEGRKDIRSPAGWYLRKAAKKTNPKKIKGKDINAQGVIDGAGILISATGPEAVKAIITPETINRMAEKPIVFILENPTPPDLLAEIGKIVRERNGVIANGSYEPNMTNNNIVFPGFLSGISAVFAKEITDKMVLSAIGALTGMIGKDLNRECILPPITPEMNFVIAALAAQAAIDGGVARVTENPFKSPDYQKAVLGKELSKTAHDLIYGKAK